MKYGGAGRGAARATAISLVGICQLALTEAIRVFSSQRVAPAGE